MQKELIPFKSEICEQYKKLAILTSVITGER